MTFALKVIYDGVRPPCARFAARGAVADVQELRTLLRERYIMGVVWGGKGPLRHDIGLNRYTYAHAPQGLATASRGRAGDEKPTDRTGPLGLPALFLLFRPATEETIDIMRVIRGRKAAERKHTSIQPI